MKTSTCKDGTPAAEWDKIRIVFYVEGCGVTSAEYRVHLVSV